jgi:hypothetical protein
MRLTRRAAAAVVTVLGVVLASLGPVGSVDATTSRGAGHRAEAARPTAEGERDRTAEATGRLFASVQPVTGVRKGSTTVVGGAILNQTREPTPVTVRLEGLPEGTSIATVRPDREHPDPADPTSPASTATAWSCDGLTCRLVTPDGTPMELAPDAGARLVLALTGDGLRPGATAKVSVDDDDPQTVPLDRPDHQPAMGDEALSLAASGSTSVAPGTTGQLEVTVANIGNTATAPGSLVVGVPTPALAGSSVTAAGAGWTCDWTRCTSAVALQPWDQAPPLTLTTVVPAAATGSGELRLSASATTTARTPLTATTTVAQDARPPETHDVSVRIDRLPQPSLSAPATQDVPVVVTATGHSTDGTALHDQVAVTLDVERHVTVDWSGARSAGPWSCSAEHRRCVSTAPLVAGAPSTIQIPVTYETGAAEGTSTIKAVATTDPDTRTGTVAADGVDRDPRSDSMTATVVVNPPPRPELRARLTSDAAATDLPGAALTFAVDEARPVVVEVTNHGSRPAPAGSVVEIAATPDVSQAVVRAGGGGWRCAGFTSSGDRDGDPYGVDSDTPLRCRTTLGSELASDATTSVPITLGASRAGSSRWTITSSIDGHRTPGGPPEFTVDVDSDVAHLVPTLQVDHGLVRGGVGSVQVTAVNHGLAAADGGVVVLDLPDGVGVRSASGEGWTCPDTAIDGAQANLTCATTDVIAPGDASGPVRLELSVAEDAPLEHASRHGASGEEGKDLGSAVAAEESTDRGTEQHGPDPSAELPTVDLWMWATAPGQVHPAASRAGTTVSLPVHPEESVDAGDDLTVATPVIGPDGVARPATVLLRGEASGSLARHVRWTQRCTAKGQPDCDGVAPAVAWLDVPSGQDPTTAVARFTAPEITAPTTLRFRLTASDGGSFERSSDVTVRLVPSASGAPGSPVGRRSASDAGPAAGAGASTSGASGSGPTAPDEVSVAIGDGSTLQVATRTTAVLAATATGTAPFTWSWEQTSGPDAEIVDGTESADLVFTAPSLEPDQTDQELTFQVTVTDALGNTATADASADVVWGDDGLIVSLADGAADVDAQVEGPVTITSQVSSAGAPYTYQWSFSGGDLELPSGTATDDATLSFTAPGEPGETTVDLKVTDSFGRVTVATVPLQVTELPAGEVPAALCDALAALAAGLPGGVATADGSVRVAIPTATVHDVPAPSPATTTTSPSTTTTTTSSTTASTTTTTTTPAASCAGSSTATFTDATVQLPGGIALSGASGELSVVGVLIDSATVTVPTNWGPVPLQIPADGLLMPFVSTTAIGLPLGSLQGTGIPFTSPAGWAGTTTVTFPSGGTPHAAIDASAAPTATGSSGHLSMTGSTVGTGSTQVELRAAGLVGLGPVDVPLAGTLSASGPSAAVVSTVTGAVTGPVPLATDVNIGGVTLDWSPTAASGKATLALGATGSPLTVQVGVQIRGGSVGTTADLVVGLPPQTWAPGGPNGPQLVLTGNGTITGGADGPGPTLALQLSGPAAASWNPGPLLQISRLVPTVTVQCPISPKGACNPSATIAGSAAVAGPVGNGQTTPVTGSLDVTTGLTTLTTSPGDLTVAPLAVTGTRLTVGLEPATSSAPTGSVVPAATGSAVVLGSSRPTTVTFAPDAVVAAATLSGLQPIPGWDLLGTVAVATTADTTYQFNGQQPVPVAAGTLTGAATTTMPTALSDGVLPEDVTSGTVTFPVAATGPVTTPTSFTLDVGDPDGWFLLGSAASATETGADAAPSLSVDTISYAIAVSGEAVTVTPSGTGSLAVPSVDATTGGDAPALDFSGALAAGTDGGLLSLTFQPGTPPPGRAVPTWSGAYGVAGLTLTGPQVQSTTTPAGTQATLNATSSLDPVLSAVLGTPPSVTATLTTPLAPASAACPSIDLSATGVDLGGLGLLLATTASLSVQPAGCTPAKGTAVATGLGVSFSQHHLGSAIAPIDPTTSAIDTTISLPDAMIDGLSLDGTTVAVTTELPDQPAALPQLAMTVSGTARLADQTLTLSGPVTAPGPSQVLGSIELTSKATSVTLPSSTGAAGDGDALVVATDGVVVLVDAVAGTGTPQFVLSGTTEVLGAPDTEVWLSGTATTSEITSLNGCVTGVGGTAVSPAADPCGSVEPIEFPLPGSGDSLTTTVDLAYVATQADSLVVSTPDKGATLVADGYEFTNGSTTLTDVGFTIDAEINMPGSVGTPVAVSGDYVVDPGSTDSTPADSTPGDFTLRTPSATPLNLSGFSVSGTATFSRAADEASAKISADLAPGLFDQDTTVTLTGDIEKDGSSTLEGDTDAVTFRGLSGVAHFTVSPGTGSTDALTNALGLQGWYQTHVSFTTAQDQCDLWTGPPPVLEGTVYRSGPVSYYTLTGQTTLVMPEGFELLTGDAQPLTLSNEWVSGTDGQPASGITVSKQWHTSTFTAIGAVSIQPAQCSYGVSATAVFGFDQGAQAAQLHGAMTPPTGISYQSGGLFGTGGSLPPDIEVTRTALEWQALHQALAQATADAQAQAQARQQDYAQWNTAAQNDQERVNTLSQQLTEAEARLIQASGQAELSAAVYAAAASSGALEGMELVEADHFAAIQELADAETALPIAESQLADAQASLANSQARATTASTEADAAAAALEDAQTQQEQQGGTTAKMVTIDFTHCEMCSPVDTFSFGGEMFFDVVYVVGVDLTIGFDENAFDSIQGSVTFGVQKQFAAGCKWIGVYASATGTVELTVGYNFAPGQGWTQLDIGIDIQANLSAYLSLWFVSYTATLLAVDIQGSINILPLPVTWQGSASLDLWGYTLEAGFGPDEM